MEVSQRVWPKRHGQWQEGKNGTCPGRLRELRP